MKLKYVNSKGGWRCHKAIEGLFLMSSLCLSTSCEDFIIVAPPKNELNATTVFNNDASAHSAIAGIYRGMLEGASHFASGGRASVTYSGAISADELVFTPTTDQDGMDIFFNKISAENAIIRSMWGSAYQTIYKANAVIEGLAESGLVSAGVKNQLEGEAKFIRAFCYFYLLNFFGDVPLVTTTDYRQNSVVSRTASEVVYSQIVADLQDAKVLLVGDYSYSNGERVRANKWAASALLARVYLYTGEWANAESEASSVMANTTIYSLVNNLSNTFLKNSSEAILQLFPYTGDGLNAWDGNVAIPALPSSIPRYDLSDKLLSAFEANDARRVNWVNSKMINGAIHYYPYKYKVRLDVSVKEYSTIFRLAEMYLIRAEARVQQNDFSGARVDINAIRSRANLPNTTAAEKAELLVAIENERRIEFFAEWGHRWLDLKRWNKIDVIVGPVKADWQPTDALYPIPTTDLQNNPRLVQNPGYN